MPPEERTFQEYRGFAGGGRDVTDRCAFIATDRPFVVSDRRARPGSRAASRRSSGRVPRTLGRIDIGRQDCRRRNEAGSIWTSARAAPHWPTASCTSASSTTSRTLRNPPKQIARRSRPWRRRSPVRTGRSSPPLEPSRDSTRRRVRRSRSGDSIYAYAALLPL